MSLTCGLPDRSHYRRVLRSRRLTTRYFDVKVYMYKSQPTSPVGYYAVNASRKVGKAVTRNSVKRRLRAIARNALPRNISADWMLIAKPPVVDASYQMLLHALRQCIRKKQRNVS